MNYEKMKAALDAEIKKHGLPDYDGSEPLAADENARLNFIAWGDPQISCVSPLRSARVYAACRDIKNARGVFDALVIAGDVTEYGAECEYKMTAELINSFSDKVKNVLAVTGNHDVRLRRVSKQAKRFNGFLKSLENGRYGSADRYSYSYEINGYKFIMLGTDVTTFEAAFIGERQLRWLEGELEQSKGGKPVFVFCHQPLKHTNGLPMTFLGRGSWRGSVGLESNRLRAIFEKFSNVIFITGHLHYCTSEYTYEDYGSFKAISLPTVGVINHGGFKSFSQGYAFSVYDDKIIAKSRVFGEGRYVEGVENSYIEIKIKGE